MTQKQPNDRMNRREVLAGLAGGTSLALAGCSESESGSGTGGESYPSEEVELIVPFSTGGGFDAYARISQPYWEEHIGNDASVSVVNVEGAGGRTGATQVYSQSGNPHQMLFWYPSAALPPQLVMDTPYNIIKMPAIGAMVRDPNAMVLRSDLGIESFDEFVNTVSDLRFGTQGVGSAAHTVTLMLSAITGAFPVEELNFVHYSGTSEAQAGMARGEIDAMIVGTVSSAADVGRSVDDAELFCVFSNSEAGGRYADQTQLFSADVSTINNLDRYAELTQFVRMLVAPPEVPDGPLGTLRDAFSAVVEDQEFIEEASNQGRPITNPGDHEAVTSILNGRREVYSQDALLSVFEDTFG
jgi:tripartite-type tricarboxylate transporter receptor subunit TctC